MKLLKNEIKVHRGENFTLDFTVVNSDGSPYILDEALENPYVLVTVSSSTYDEVNRYLLNVWLDLSPYPKFVSTIPEKVSTLPTGSNIKLKTLYYSENTKKYVYYNTESNTWTDYELAIRINFDVDITNDWIGKKYLYSIKLVTGKLSEDKLPDVPLTEIYSTEIFLPPTNLYVQSDLNGGNKWI